MNINVLDKVSLQGSPSKENEDLILIDDGVVVVLDGATGLGGSIIQNEVSDAKWFVENISKYFLLSWKENNDFMGSLRSAIETVTNLFKEHTFGVQFHNYEKPSSGMIAVAIEKDGVNLYHAGDCTAIYKGEDIEYLFENGPLEQLDRISISKLRKNLINGLPYAEARRNILPILRGNREKMNAKDGYPSLTIGTRCINFIEKRCFHPRPGDKLLLCSDGFSAIYNKYDSYKVENFFSSERKPLELVVSLLRDIENNDKSLLKYPRLKPHDDATAVLLEFHNHL